MGVTKTHIYTNKQNEIASMAKIFAHPARVAILEELINHKQCMCTSIAEKIGLAQPTVSRHLKEMKDSGIIKGTIEGTAICYCLDSKAVKKIGDTLKNLLTNIQQIANCC